MKVLAAYNIKGGVGKTSAAVNLAWLAAASGARTLICDLDPQGAATWCFRVRMKVRGGGQQTPHGLRSSGGIDVAGRGHDLDHVAVQIVANVHHEFFVEDQAAIAVFVDLDVGVIDDLAEFLD